MLSLRDTSGKVTRCPTGFSWSTLFFGPFVPLFRGWLPMVPIYLGGSLLTFGVFALVMPFEINRYWVSFLLERGYAPATPADAKMIADMGLPNPSIPKWAALAPHLFRLGDVAPYGLYVALNRFDYRFVGEDNTPLEGLDGVEYMRLPLLLTVALIPFLGLAFYLAFPAVIILMCAGAVILAIAAPIRAFADRSAHLTEMHWNPITAHMKRPRDKEADLENDREEGDKTQQ